MNCSRRVPRPTLPKSQISHAQSIYPRYYDAHTVLNHAVGYNALRSIQRLGVRMPVYEKIVHRTYQQRKNESQISLSDTLFQNSPKQMGCRVESFEKYSPEPERVLLVVTDTRKRCFLLAFGGSIRRWHNPTRAFVGIFWPYLCFVSRLLYTTTSVSYHRCITYKHQQTTRKTHTHLSHSTYYREITSDH